jgi:hypothetical protein
MYITMLCIKYELMLQWHWDLSSKYCPGDRSFKFKLSHNAFLQYSAQRLFTWEGLKTIQCTEACAEGLCTVKNLQWTADWISYLLYTWSLNCETNIFKHKKANKCKRQSNLYNVLRMNKWLSHTQVAMVTSGHTWASMVMLDVTMVLTQLGLWVTPHPVTMVMHVENKRKLGRIMSDITHKFLLRWLLRGWISTLILCHAIKKLGQV